LFLRKTCGTRNINSSAAQDFRVCLSRCGARVKQGRQCFHDSNWQYAAATGLSFKLQRGEHSFLVENNVLVS
jgi:hypothetical protein